MKCPPPPGLLTFMPSNFIGVASSGSGFPCHFLHSRDNILLPCLGTWPVGPSLAALPWLSAAPAARLFWNGGRGGGGRGTPGPLRSHSLVLPHRANTRDARQILWGGGLDCQRRGPPQRSPSRSRSRSRSPALSLPGSVGGGGQGWVYLWLSMAGCSVSPLLPGPGMPAGLARPPAPLPPRRQGDPLFRSAAFWSPQARQHWGEGGGKEAGGGQSMQEGEGGLAAPREGLEY